MFFLNENCRSNRALPSVELEYTSVTPEMLCNDFSNRFTISRSTVSGDAPG